MPEKQGYQSPLIDDRLVPAGKACVYALECISAKTGACNHRGVDQKENFSCAFARGFNIIYRNEFNKSGRS